MSTHNICFYGELENFFPELGCGWVWQRCRGILRHQGVQLILSSSWARPAILVVGKDKGGMFLYFFYFFSFILFLFRPCPSFSSPLLSLLSHFSLSL